MRNRQNNLVCEVSGRDGNDQDSTQDSILKGQQIPFSHLIFNPQKDTKKVLEHCKAVFDAVYLINGLSKSVKNIIDKKTTSKTMMLKGSNAKNKFKKTLFVDLDETLIHSVFTEDSTYSQKIIVDNKQIWFNVRPYALDFLRNMSQIFEVVLFTAAEKLYAQAFFDYLNLRSGNAISELLHREHCIHIFKGLYFKDLRIIGNRKLKDMILVDNSPHCFGNLLSNGVPIASFINDNRDQELQYIQHYLSSLKDCEDVREANRQQLRLSEILGVTKISI